MSNTFLRIVIRAISRIIALIIGGYLVYLLLQLGFLELLESTNGINQKIVLLGLVLVWGLLVTGISLIVVNILRRLNLDWIFGDGS